MTAPGPVRLPLLAKRLRKPEGEVRQAVRTLCRSWGEERVLVPSEGLAVVITPAAVTAVHQHFGIRDVPQHRACPSSTKEPRA